MKADVVFIDATHIKASANKQKKRKVLAEDFRHSHAGKESYSLRSQTIERVFADAKENHGLRYTLLRGLNRVSNGVRLKFATLNLKKLAMWA